jgi:hypothetical protein
MERKTEEEIREGLASRDNETRAVAIQAHEYNLNNPEIEEQNLENIEVVEQPLESTPIEDNEVVLEEIVDTTVDEDEVVVDKSAEYIKLLESNNREFEEKLNTESAESARLRQDLENKQRLLDETKFKLDNPVITKQPDINLLEEDDEYATDFSKNTRLMLQKTRDEIASLSSNDPRYNDLQQQVKNILDNQTRIDNDITQKAEEKEQEALNTKLYEDVNNFQTSHEEFATPKDVKEINGEFLGFRKQLATVNAIDPNDDIAINVLEAKYFKQFDGGAVHQRMEEMGIKPPDGTEALRKIIEYNDIKNGYRIDDMTGKKLPIKDSLGQQVRYATIEDAFIVTNYATLKAEMENKASVEIINKLNNRDNSAVGLGNNLQSMIERDVPQEEVDYYIGLKKHQVMKLPPDQKVKWAESWRSRGSEPPTI